MSIATLSLPIDIPWKRIAVSGDMYAPSENGPLPAKWQSSLAVFSYDPPPDPDLSNPDERTTFLKVVATVTGYQPEGIEIDRDVARPGFRASAFQAWQDLAGKYYPALAALVQVAVFPKGGTWTIEQYPYLTDFEPKKREMVELVSETGEALSSSATNLNVRKGTTTTNSTENDAIYQGGSFGFGGGLSAGEVGLNFSGSGSSQREMGSRTQLGTEGVNITTTDASREKRESFSHTTNLSQLYQLLDSYHSGTNRAVFFLNARPHVVDSPLTFVNGPRRLEGVQEFFLVMRRPVAMEEYCVKAVLETAHLAETVTTETTTKDVPPPGSITQSFAGASTESDAGTAVGGTIKIPDGYMLDTSRGGGTQVIHFKTDDETETLNVSMPPGTRFHIEFATDSEHAYEIVPKVTLFDDHVEFWSKVYDGSAKLDGKVFYKWATPPETVETSHTNVDLYITAREVSSCPHPDLPVRVRDPQRYVVFEKALGGDLRAALRASTGSGRDAAVAANAVSRRVHDEVIGSFRSDRRYAPGMVDFARTSFALRALRSGAKPVSTARTETLLARSTTLDEAARTRIADRAPSMTVGQAVRLGPEALARRIGGDEAEARWVLAQLLGVRSTGVPRGDAPRYRVARGTSDPVD